MDREPPLDSLVALIVTLSVLRTRVLVLMLGEEILLHEGAKSGRRRESLAHRTQLQFRY
jgi:hypothetical protein